MLGLCSVTELRTSSARTFMLLLAVCGATAMEVSAGAAFGVPQNLRTRKALNEALNAPRSLQVTNVPLRQVLADLQTSAQVAILLDRRTDPSRRIDVATQYQATRQVLQAVADAVPQTAVSFGDQYVFLGPDASAERLRTLVEINRQSVQELRRILDADIYRRLVAVRSVSWSELAEPRQLMTQAAADAGLQLQNPELVPHDVWAAAELPSMTFADFATLVLNQFDQTFQITADGQLILIPVPPVITIQRTHRVPSKQRETIVADIGRLFPDLAVEWNGSQMVVQGTVEQHTEIQALLHDKPAGTMAAQGLKTRQFTMKVPAGTQFGQLLQSLKSSGIVIRIEGKTQEQLQPLLQQTLEFDLQNLPGPEFFPQVFATWNAQVTVDDAEVVITFP